MVAFDLAKVDVRVRFPLPAPNLLYMNSDISFWKGINPNFHINDGRYLNSHGPLFIQKETLESVKSSIVTEGYFQLPPINYHIPISDLALSISRLKKNDISPVYSFVYDEYWLLFYKLHSLIQSVLGDGYMRLPDFWAWHVDPKKNESGWRPHRDRGHHALNSDGTPKSVTVWIPLTDATPLNSCMYIVPADRDPTYGTAEDSSFKFDYSNIRALPASAGAVFCWNQAVLHWGSSSSDRASHPRISLAFEFQRGDVPSYNEPLTQPNSFPSFEERLEFISKQIRQYEHMYSK